MPKLPTVKKQFRNLHPEADRVYATLKVSRPDKYGFLRYGNRYPARIHLRVTPGQSRRMALLLDVLFRVVEQLGGGSGVERDHGEILVLKVQEERFGFTLWQGLQKVLAEPSKEEKKRAKYSVKNSASPVWRGDYIPSDQFTLQLEPLRLNDNCVRRTWKDTLDKPLELQLDKIASGLTKYAAKAREIRLERAARERERAAEQKRQLERKRQQAAEQERRAQLERDAEAWHRAELVRRYVAAVETEALSRQGPIDPEGELGRWFAWARQHADRIDPRGSAHSSRSPLEQLPRGIASKLS